MESPASTSSPRETAPSSGRLPALIAANVVLLAALVVVTIGGRNHALAAGDSQPGGSPTPRSRGAYTAILTPAANGNTSVLVVADSVNQELVILGWDKTRKTFIVNGYRDLAADSNEVIGR